MLIDQVVTVRLEQDAIEVQLADPFGRRLDHVVRPGEAGRTAAVALRPARLDRQVKLQAALRQVVEVVPMDVPGQHTRRGAIHG